MYLSASKATVKIDFRSIAGFFFPDVKEECVVTRVVATMLRGNGLYILDLRCSAEKASLVEQHYNRGTIGYTYCD